MSAFPDTVSLPPPASDFELPRVERRSHERYPSKGRHLVYALGRPEPLLAELLNISAGGALFSMPPLEIGTAVSVVFGGGASGFDVDGVVVRQSELPGSHVDLMAIGVRFDRSLPT